MRLLKTTILLSIFGCVTTASAQSSFLVTVDSAPQVSAGVETGSEVILNTSKERSYCCQVNPIPTASALFSSLTNFASVNPAPLARGAELPPINTQIPTRRYCWYEASTGSSVSRALVVDTNSNSITAAISCNDTTLTGSYNTSVSEFNFLEITGETRVAATNSTISGKILFRSAIDNTVIERDFSIAFVDGGNAEISTIRRIDLAVHDLIGNKADFGQIRIRHDGAPGQISAKISYYDVTSTSPLDFTLVGQDNFRMGTAGN